MVQSKLHSGIVNAVFMMISALMALPLVLVVSVSFSSEQSIIQHGFQFLPVEFSTIAYRYVFEYPKVMLHAYGVTILVTVCGTLLSLVLTSMMAYAISRRDYRYRNVTTLYVFFTMLFSGGLVPYYILMTQYLHLNNTLWALIVPGLLSPWNIMILKGFLAKLPFEIIESAKMDGAKEWRIFLTIIIPLSTPALATLGLLISFAYWNEWFNALLYIDDERLVPIQLLLVRTMNAIEVLTSNQQVTAGLGIDISQFPNLSARMALAVVAAGPMLFVFPFFQRYFVQGLTVGSLKG